MNSITPGGNWVQLNDIVQGNDHGARQGREIQLTSLKLRQLLRSNASGSHYVRIIAGYIKDHSAFATTTQIFDSPAGGNPTSASGVGGGNGVSLMILPINKALFTTVYDKTVKLGANSSVDGYDCMILDKYINLQNRKVRYDGSTTGPTNSDQSLWLGCITAEAPNDTAGGSTVEWSFTADLKFIDL